MEPLASFRFRLEPADVLPYERLPRELVGRWKVAFLAVPFAGGASAGLVPDHWSDLERWGVAAAAAALLAVILLGGREVLRRRRARRLAADNGTILVEDEGDHLVVHSLRGTRFLALEMIGAVISTDAAVFILHEDGPTIIPLRAFEDANGMQAYAEVLDLRSAAAVP